MGSRRRYSPPFRLRFPARDIPFWASRFSDDQADGVETVAARARSRGHLTRTEFLALCRWKTPRSQPRCRRNPAEKVRNVTRAAFASANDGEKASLLLSMDGVGLPTASVILHFCDERPFPILDVRALWSLGFRKPPGHTLPFWIAYVDFTRELARSAACDMRALDRALWQYSKERQRR